MKGIAVGTLTFLPATFVSVSVLAEIPLEHPLWWYLWSPSSAPLSSTISQPMAATKNLSLSPTGSGCIGFLQLHYQSWCFLFGYSGRIESSGIIKNILVVSEQEQDISWGQEEQSVKEMWRARLTGSLIRCDVEQQIERYPHSSCVWTSNSIIPNSYSSHQSVISSLVRSKQPP